MSSSDLPRRLNDIVENADRISTYLGGLDEDSFAKDDKSVAATDRCLARIVEAVVKIGAETMAKFAPDIPFERIRGLGNVLRHGYDDIDLKILFSLANEDVPTRRAAATRALDPR